MTLQPPPLPVKRPAIARTYPICSVKEAMALIKTKCGHVYIRERHGKGYNKIFILPEASQEMDCITSYGRRSPMNVFEQKLLGMGHFLITEDTDMILIISHFIEIQTMHRTSVSASNLGPNGEYNPGLDFLEYHREEYVKNETRFNNDAFGNQVDPFLEFYGASEYVLSGHTHPDLGVFFSTTDRESGRARAANLPICTFVCDPIRRKMLGCIGKNFEDAEIIVFSRKDHDPTLIKQDKRLNPPTEEMVQLASKCLHTPGYSGDIRLRTRLDGRGSLEIKLVIPRNKNGE